MEFRDTYNKLLLVGISLILVFHNSGFAQSKICLPVTLVDHAHGLEDTHNFFFYKDSRKLLWVSSWAGLHSYDGNSIEVYLPDDKDTGNISGKHIRGEMLEDIKGNLWLSTYDAINCYEREKDRFKYYRINQNKREDYYLITIDSKEHLWLMQGGELYTFDIQNERFEWKANLHTGVNRLHAVKDRQGRVRYIIAFSREIRENSGFTILKFNQDSLLQNRRMLGAVSGPDEVVKDVFIDNETIAWVVCNRGLYRVNLDKFTMQKYWPNTLSSNSRLRAVERVNDSLLLIASYSDGFFTFHPRKGVFLNNYQLTSNEQVISEVPQSIYRDPDGGVWISVGYRGFAYYHPKHIFFEHYKYDLRSPSSNSRISLNSLLEIEDGKVWGSSVKHGAVIFEHESTIAQHYHTQTPTQLSDNATIMSYLDSKDRVWILTESSLCLRYPDGMIQTIEADKERIFRSICELQDGIYVLGSRTGGLYKMEEKSKGKFSIDKIQTIPSKKIYTYLMRLPQGYILGSSNLSQLDVIQEKESEIVQSFPINAEVHCISRFPDEETLWLGTDRGVFTYNLNWEKPILRRDIHCVTNMIVYGILPQSDSTFVLSSNKGIHYYNKNTGSCENFGEFNGTGAPSFRRFSYLQHSTGDLWFGNAFGITILDPKRIQPQKDFANVLITSIHINEHIDTSLICAKTGAENVSEIESIVLPYKKNTISLEFSAISYKGMGRAEYQYRLRNFDEDWIQSGSRGFARYANLSPGNYIFDVKANAGDAPVHSLSINIIAPFYMKWWFILGLLLILGFIIYQYFKSRENRKQKLQELRYKNKLAINVERLRIAHDVHDNLGSSISAIGLRTKLIADQLDAGPVRDKLESLSETIGDLTQQVRETIWTINSDNDTIDRLITRLHQYAMEFFDDLGIEGSVRLPLDQRNDKILGDHRREIFLAFKEALHNIQRHSNAQKVDIYISFYDGHYLNIKITDDGTGFDIGNMNENNGTGLRSMKRRMNACGGRFKITSEQKGTSVLFQYPF